MGSYKLLFLLAMGFFALKLDAQPVDKLYHQLDSIYKDDYSNTIGIDDLYTLEEGETATVDGTGFKEHQMFMEVLSLLGVFSRIEDKDLREYFTAIPVRAYDKNSIQFKNRQYEISISGGKFDKNKHKVIQNFTVYGEPGESASEIDGKKWFWGTDGGIPDTEIRKLGVSFNNKKIVIPDSATANLYKPAFENVDKDNLYRAYKNKAFLSKDGKRLYIYVQNGTAAGAYDLIWIFQDNKYYGRVATLAF